jgi:hypothetical protein
VVLNCHGEVTDMAAVAEALPTMPHDARERLDAALAATDGSRTGDRAALIAKRDTLLELARDIA